MKCIILGSSGFIGKALHHALLEKKHEVIAFTHKDFDITEPFKLPYADVLYHLSANSRVYLARQNPLLDFKTNAMGTLHVLEACVQSGIKKIVYASTVLVYENLWKVDENDKTGYNEYGGAYGISKLTGEEYLQYYSSSYGIKGVSFRISNPYGPGMRKNLIFDLITGFLRGEKMSIYLSSDSMTDFIYIDDVTSTMIHAMDPNFEGIYNLSSGLTWSTKRIVELISSFFQTSIPVEYGNKIVKICAKNDKLKKTGWDIKTSLNKGLDKTIKYFRNKR